MFQGKLKKDGKYWISEVPDLDLATQGKSKKEAREMMADAIESLVNKKGFEVYVIAVEPNKFIVGANNLTFLIALFLKRQRAAMKMTVREVAQRMKYKSHAAYAQYEQGKSMPGIDVIDRFIRTVRAGSGICLTTVH